MALKYIKLLWFKTTPALKDNDGKTAVSIRAKETLVQRLAFLKRSKNLIETPVILSGSAHIKINEEVVSQVLITQAATKAPGPNKILFLDFADDIGLGQGMNHKYSISCYITRPPPNGIIKSLQYPS